MKAKERKRRNKLQELKRLQGEGAQRKRTSPNLGGDKKVHRALRRSYGILKKVAPVALSFVIAASSILGSSKVAQAGSIGFSFRPDPRGALSPYPVQDPRFAHGPNHGAFYKGEMAHIEREEDHVVQEFGNRAAHVFVVTSSTSNGGNPMQGVTYNITCEDHGSQRNVNVRKNNGRGTVTLRWLKGNIIRIEESIELNGGGFLRTEGYMDADSGKLKKFSGSMSSFMGHPGYNLFFEERSFGPPKSPLDKETPPSLDVYLALLLAAKPMVAFKVALAELSAGTRQYREPLRSPQGVRFGFGDLFRPGF